MDQLSESIDNDEKVSRFFVDEVHDDRQSRDTEDHPMAAQ